MLANFLANKYVDRMARSDTQEPQHEADDTDELVASRVKVLLVRTKEQRQDLAERLGISPSSLSRSLSDDPTKRREWSGRDIRRLSVHFGVNPELFWTDEESFWEAMGKFRKQQQADS